MSNLPENWDCLPLGELAEIRVSNVDKKTTPGEHPVRLCNYTDVYNNTYLYANNDYMEATATQAEIDKFRLQAGDVVITKDSETPDDIGIPAIIESSAPTLICGYHLAILRCGSQIDPTWLAKQIEHYDVAHHLGRVAVGTTRYGLGYNVIVQTPIRIAPMPEQLKVSHILRTVDKAIQQTDALIAKLRQMKAGLLHDLLTRGLDENSELRDPVAHPEQFQESALGLIPVGWEVRILGEVGNWLSGGTPYKSSPAYWDGAVPWVSPKDMKVFLLDDTEDHVSELGAREGSRIVPPGTVFIVVRGMILAHTFPVAITMREMAFNQDMKAIITYENVSATYLAYWFIANSSAMLGLVTESTHGTKRFDLDDLLRYELQLPPLKEQQAIVDILATYDIRIQAEEATREKLALLKCGLMDDLLTGRVRVNVVEEKA